MFDDDLPKKKVKEFPCNLDTLSVQELEEYIQELEGEIERVRQDITRKKTSQDAAAAFFKD